jgi:hypothetical protein
MSDSNYKTLTDKEFEQAGKILEHLHREWVREYNRRLMENGGHWKQGKEK